MLIPKRKNKIKKEMKPIAFRVSPLVVDEFRKLCKEIGVTQSSIIENAMMLAIAEMKGSLKDDK